MSTCCGPNLLDLIDQVQASRLDDSGNREWASFAILSEILANVSLNKLRALKSADGPDLVQQLEADLKKSKTNDQRIKCILDRPDIRAVLEFFADNLLGQVRQNGSKTATTSKSGPVASKYLAEACELRMQSRYEQALVKCDEAIRHAPVGSEELDENSNEDHKSHLTKNFSGSGDESSSELLSKCYFERARILFELERFEDAAHEANLAASFHQTDILESFIDNIKGKISECPKSVVQTRTLEKIYSKRKITTLSKELVNGNDFLHLTISDAKGRHLVVNRAVDPNEVLLDERPFVAWLRPSQYEQYCHQCLKPLTLIVPCAKCNRVSYCSNTCKVNSWLQFHFWECENLLVLKALSKGHLALRIVIVAGVKKALDFHRNYKETNYELESHENAYSSVYLLVDHATNFDFVDIFENAMGATFMALIAKRYNIINEADVNDLAGLLLKHILQIAMNGIQIVRQDILEPEELGPDQFKFRIKQSEESIGFGLYPTLSLLNHACFNRTKSLFNGSQITFVSNTKLAKGSEVTFNYGPHYKAACLEERRRILKDTYFFFCECEACVNDWQ